MWVRHTQVANETSALGNLEGLAGLDLARCDFVAGILCGLALVDAVR